MYEFDNNTHVVRRFDFIQLRQFISLMQFYESDEGLSENESEVDLMIQLCGMVGEGAVLEKYSHGA